MSLLSHDHRSGFVDSPEPIVLIMSHDHIDSLVHDVQVGRAGENPLLPLFQFPGVLPNVFCGPQRKVEETRISEVASAPQSSVYGLFPNSAVNGSELTKGRPGPNS